jgi:hypothetical protein
MVRLFETSPVSLVHLIHLVRTYLKIVDSRNIRTYKYWHAASA